MKGRLLKNITQDVPEEISVCEFECRKSTCTARDLTECELHQQASKGIHSINRYNAYMISQKPNTKRQPILLYELLPFIYLVAGFTVFYHYDSFIGYGVGGLLLITSIIIWAMRLKYRAMHIHSHDNSRPYNSNRS